MYNRPVPGPEPDLSGGMAGLQMATSTMESSSRNGSPAPGTPRAKPIIPQKKNHIDEILRLKKELEAAREDRDQACGERDAMETDLLSTQEALEEKEEALRKLSREVWTWRDKAEKMSKDTPDEKRLSTQGRRSFAERPSSASSSREANSKIEAELAEARQEVQRLTSALAESQTRLRSSASPAAGVDQRQVQVQIEQLEGSLRSEEKLRRAAEASLHDTSTYYQNKLSQVEMQAQTQIEEQQRRLQEVEAGLQGGLQRMEVDSGDSEELQRLRQLAAEHERRVDEQRQCAEQYRRMSERLTTQVKQANMAKRGVEQSEQTLRQQMEDMRSQLNASQQRRPMPGSFQRY
jgi:hypothetical protein